ncbi:hypothetical protein WMY93_012645 [Mugilogobius chulae]|uniref:Fibronectin type-III domain-containing protein n=1 Tax=Mugilogobius chulae TaxID=88201 RepID=A0AAW0P3U8_9GOBI
MENFAGHLEEIFLTVEENFGRREQHLEQHYNDVLQTLSQRYDDRGAALQEEKKSKLESLYRQLLDCGRALDSSKELIESAQEVHRCHDKRLFLKMAMPTIKRIEESAKDDLDLTLSTSLEFNTPLADLSDVKNMMDSINVVPVNKVKVKETHCTVSELLPNAQYELWVTATNTTGISPASEKALYMTGTYFSLLEESSHHCLCFSEDMLTISYGYEDPPISAMAFDDIGFTRCVAVLGDLIPSEGVIIGRWRSMMDEYRVGVAYEDTDRNSPGLRPGTLSFYNVDLKQHLHTFQCNLRNFVHPCFGLDNPGELSIHNGIETPKFTFI